MTGGTREEWEMGDLGTIELLESEAWFDSVGSGSVEANDELATALVALMAAFDADFAPVADVEQRVGGVVTRETMPRSRRALVSRITAGVACATVLLGGVAGVAAASPGSPLYRVHVAIFGDSDDHGDRTRAADKSLTKAEIIIAAGVAHHGVTSAQRHSASALIESARVALAGLRDAVDVAALRGRVGADVVALAALSTLDERAGSTTPNGIRGVRTSGPGPSTGANSHDQQGSPEGDSSGGATGDVNTKDPSVDGGADAPGSGPTHDGSGKSDPGASSDTSGTGLGRSGSDSPQPEISSTASSTETP